MEEVKGTRDILALLYEKTDGEHWTQNNRWLKSQDFCNWEGIQCNEQNNVED